MTGKCKENDNFKYKPALLFYLPPKQAVVIEEAVYLRLSRHTSDLKLHCELHSGLSHHGYEVAAHAISPKRQRGDV